MLEVDTFGNWEDLSLAAGLPLAGAQGVVLDADFDAANVGCRSEGSRKDINHVVSFIKTVIISASSDRPGALELVAKVLKLDDEWAVVDGCSGVAAKLGAHLAERIANNFGSVSCAQWDQATTDGELGRQVSLEDVGNARCICSPEKDG